MQHLPLHTDRQAAGAANTAAPANTAAAPANAAAAVAAHAGAAAAAAAANTEQQCTRSKGSRYEILIAHNAAHRRREGEGQGGPAAAGPGHVALAH